MVQESERGLAPFRIPVTEVQRPVGHVRVQADRQAVGRGGTYYGAVLLADAVGAATAAIYDGLDTSGELIDFLDTDAASDHDRSFFPRGLRLIRGLYVDLGSNVSAFTAYYDPPPAERQ